MGCGKRGCPLCYPEDEIARLRADIAAGKRALAAEQRAHSLIATLCHEAGVSTPDGTSTGAVREVVKALAEAQARADALHGILQNKLADYNSVKVELSDAKRERDEAREGRERAEARVRELESTTYQCVDPTHQAQAERVGALEGLQPYLAHKRGCSIAWDEHMRCNCGLADAKAKAALAGDSHA